WRIRLGPPGHHRNHEGGDEKGAGRHPVRPLHPRLDAGKPGQPNLVQGYPRQACRAPDRTSRRQAPRDDALDQAARIGRPRQELIEDIVQTLGAGWSAAAAAGHANLEGEWGCRPLAMTLILQNDDSRFAPAVVEHRGGAAPTACRLPWFAWFVFQQRFRWTCA